MKNAIGPNLVAVACPKGVRPDHPTIRLWLLLLAGLVLGWWLRQLAFDHTYDLRSVWAQQNAFYWGDRVVHGINHQPGPVSWHDLWRSYVRVYDTVQTQPIPGHTLDYVPLRLLWAAVWVNHLNSAYGPVTAWQPEFSRSFTALSTVAELAGAIILFAWVARHGRRREPFRPHVDRPVRWTRWNQAAAVAGLFWFNPAAIINSHVWPQGETWIVPFYLLAAFAVSERWYLSAGMLLGIGAMFKGQLMIVAPVLILWPAFDRQRTGALRVAGGVALGVTLITWPWLAHGSFAWAHAGFAAHVAIDDVLRKGPGFNLPAVLSKWGHLTLHQRLVHLHVRGLQLRLEVRTALISLYAILLACCAWGMSRQARANDSRLLISIAAPWAVMFFVMGQMDERYLVWSACISATAVASIAVNRWSLAAHLMLTWAASVTMLQAMLFDRPGVRLGLRAALDLASPLTAIATTLAVGILFKLTLQTGPDRTPSRASTPTAHPVPPRRLRFDPAPSQLTAPLS